MSPRRNYAYRNPDLPEPGSGPPLDPITGSPQEGWKSMGTGEEVVPEEVEGEEIDEPEVDVPVPAPRAAQASLPQLPVYETTSRPRRRRKIKSVRHHYHRAMDKLCQKAERAVALWKAAERIYRKQRLDRREAARVGLLLAEVARIFGDDMKQLQGAVAAFSGLGRDWDAMEAGQTVGYWISGRGVRTVKPYGKHRKR
jgi:hypothetical protein